MNENPYASPVETTFSSTSYDASGETPPLAVGHLTFVLVCGGVLTAISLLGLGAMAIGLLNAGVWTSYPPTTFTPSYSFYLHGILDLTGPSLAFGFGTWQLWQYRKATLLKNAGAIGWPQFTVQHNQFCKAVTISILTLFAFRVLNSLYVTFFY